MVKLRRDHFLQLCRELASACFGLVAVDDGREGIHRLAVDQQVELHQLVGARAGVLIVHRAVAAGDALNLVVEVHEDFVEREHAGEHDAARVERLGVLKCPPLFHDELHERRNVFVRHHDEALDDRLADFLDDAEVGQILRIVHVEDLAVGLHHLIDNRWIRRDDVHVVFPAQALEDDLHVEKSEEPAAEAEAESHAAFGLEDER